jgi:two-component system, response regulator PdtaR
MEPSPSSAGTETRVSALRILAADSDPAMCRIYHDLLTALGHKVVIARTGQQAVELCRAVPPDLLVMDTAFPDWDGRRLAAELGPAFPVPVLLVSGRPGPDALWSSPESPVVGYLGKPVVPATLGPAIAIAVRCGHHLRAFRQEAADLRQQLEDRKVIERAKGLVVRYTGLPEEAAYTRMRKLASDQNRKLVDVARAIMAAGEAFSTLEHSDERRPSGGRAGPSLRGDQDAAGPT